MNETSSHDEQPGDASPGERSGAEELTPLVYEHLRGVAAKYFREQMPDHTLQPTALVHEAFLKMADQCSARYVSEAHFCAIAAIAMRQILINHAEKRTARKRGGGRRRVALDDALRINVADDSYEDVLALHEALLKLESRDPRKAKVVEMRFFGGLSAAQSARVLDVSVSTVESDWRLARAWLSWELSGA